jgi:predicted nucleotidyltransferase
MSCMLVTMKLAHPMQSVIPSAHGAVLGVLARTSEPMSGRQIATLTRPRFSQSRVNRVLGELARDGIAEVDARPPASYYRLNRDHVAAPGIMALASMWQTLLDRIQDLLTEWPTPPTAAWLFGSAARAEANEDSDVDIILVRPDELPDDEAWLERLDDLTDQVRRWSGNACELLVLTESELQAAVQRGDRLADELRRDAIHLAGAQPHALLGRRAS